MKKPIKTHTGVLKIAYVLDDGLDREDGVQQYILSIGNWMRLHGHEVHYMVGETKRTDILNLHSLTNNLRVKFNGNKLTIPLPANTKAIKKILDAENFDVIHVQVPYSPAFAAKVVSLAKSKSGIIGTFHILPYGPAAVAGTKILGIILSRNLRKFDMHLAVSEPAKAFAERTFKIDSKIVPNAVDLKKFRNGQKTKSQSGQTKILFLGRLVERKGCGYLLDALGLIAETEPGVSFRLDICGKGELLEELREKSKKLGISDRVYFHGFVSEREKITFMQNTDLAVFPSTAGESFGIVLIEAMAAGSGVVIGGDNPGYRSVLGPVPETIADVKNILGFSELLKNFITNIPARTQARKKQQRLVEQYDVEVVGKKLLSEYMKIAK